MMGGTYVPPIYFRESLKKHIKTIYQSKALSLKPSFPGFLVHFFTLWLSKVKKTCFFDRPPHTYESVTPHTHVPRPIFNSMFNF